MYVFRICIYTDLDVTLDLPVLQVPERGHLGGLLHPLDHLQHQQQD